MRTTAPKGGTEKLSRLIVGVAAFTERFRHRDSMLNHERKSSVVSHVWILSNISVASLKGFLSLAARSSVKMSRGS